MKKNSTPKTFAEKAYKSTIIDAGITQNRITDMLEQLNINNLRFTKQGNDHRMEFIVKLYPDEAARKIWIDIPFTPMLGETPKQMKRRKDAIYRILMNNLKDRFVSIYNGLRTFDEVFLPDIVIIHNGTEMRISDIITPMIKKQLGESEKVILTIKKGNN